jgi:uncharacterized protein YegJ (DUF2314 family)
VVPWARHLRHGLTAAIVAVSAASLAQPSNPYASAQADLRHFNEALARPMAADYFRVLVEVRQGKLVETFWLNHVRHEGAVYTGRLETIPRVLVSLNLGQQLRLEAKDILDWHYQDRATRTIYGHYNLCAEFQSLLAPEAAEQMAYWRVACKPAP